MGPFVKHRAVMPAAFPLLVPCCAKLLQLCATLCDLMDCSLSDSSVHACPTLVNTQSVGLTFPGGSDGKESARDTGDPGSIPGSGRSPGERNGNPLQYSCLVDSMDRGAWWAIVHGVAKSQKQLKQLSMHALIICERLCLPMNIKTI